MKHVRILAFLSVAVCIVSSQPAHATRWEPAQGQPATVENLVPVDVHVVDRNGKPVTDLKQSDFTVLENGVALPIRSFTAQTFAAGTPPADARLALHTRVALAPQDHRIFVIMLGRGRLEDPSMAITSLAAFVRKLLPQDRVALFAHDRALGFTTDHEKVAQALERCKKTHLDVDLDVDNLLGPTGMAALYGTKAVSRKGQAKIDEMVQGPAFATPAPLTTDTVDEKAFADLSLDQFMFSSALMLQDRGNLQMLLEYLRHYEGEKHLLFVTERGLDKAAAMPSEEYDHLLAELANDGRTAIHTLQTGGMATQADNTKDLEASQQQALAFGELRTIAESSGGATAIMKRGGTVLDTLDEATKTRYLLGYQSSTGWDGSYRPIVVKVNRPDVTVYYRHGYYRQQGAGDFDRRGQIVADRLTAGGGFRREINDIKVKARASQNHGQGGGNLTVDGKIDLSKVVLADAEGNHVTTLNVAIFCIDSSGWGVGSHDGKISVSLTDDELARYKKDGMPFQMQFPILRGTDHVRFVVYDYRADLIGSTDQRLF